jgi:hypothetical protein
MNGIVTLLQQNGYSVYKFYDPNNQWEAIKRAASDASIIIYDGHGTQMGIDGNYGGLVIDDFISGKRIASELKLKRKALVIYSSVCGGAGSSASDTKDIGIEEAKRRVLGSGLPYILAGAGAYFAINEVNGVESFLNNWFQEEIKRLRLTDAEREALEVAVEYVGSAYAVEHHAATLRRLLDRTK